MAFQVYWDNGANACGVFPQKFDTEEEAQSFADDWVAETGDDAEAEVIGENDPA